MQVLCPTPRDTETLGARLAASLRPGDVIVLAGGLGAGKTLFTGLKDRLPLTLTRTTTFSSGNILLHYRPAGG